LNNSPFVSVVIPFFQRDTGLLVKAVDSVYEQSYSGKILVVIVDDGSPLSANEELKDFKTRVNRELLIIEQKNQGAGAARNNALNNVHPDTKYVAFIDSDDQWTEDHVANGVKALQMGYQAYFSDHYAAMFPDVGNFDRIGTLNIEDHKLLDRESKIYQMTISALEHTVADGGGVIGTSNVIYDYKTFQKLRFREEFYNGQDFFFWMDLSVQGAKWVFSTNIECRCGTGINIYSGSGWGTDKSLQRLRNELFIWTSVAHFYALSNFSAKANKKTIKALQVNIGRDLLHRVLHRKAISSKLLKDIVGMAPSTILYFFLVPLLVIKEKFSRG
jgi:succinoglycan biosynthesis protein ExoW